MPQQPIQTNRVDRESIPGSQARAWREYFPIHEYPAQVANPDRFNVLVSLITGTNQVHTQASEVTLTDEILTIELHNGRQVTYNFRHVLSYEVDPA